MKHLELDKDRYFVLSEIETRVPQRSVIGPVLHSNIPKKCNIKIGIFTVDMYKMLQKEQPKNHNELQTPFLSGV